jgi:hypothetical protein
MVIICRLGVSAEVGLVFANQPCLDFFEPARGRAAPASSAPETPFWSAAARWLFFLKARN